MAPGPPTPIRIDVLDADSRTAWEELFRGYNAFYGRGLTSALADRAWAELTRGERMHLRGAFLNDQLVGIVHFLAHVSTTSPDVCYLQDLFTTPDVRGRGVGRALIGAVVEWARERDLFRVYWMTHETNATARRLYDDVADYRGFIRYEITL